MKTMNSKDKNAYEAPRLTVVEFRSERGYSSSDSSNLIVNQAERLNRQIGHLTDQSLWQHNQHVFGTNHATDVSDEEAPGQGMAATYFYEETTSWF